MAHSSITHSSIAQPTEKSQKILTRGTTHDDRALPLFGKSRTTFVLAGLSLAHWTFY